MRMVLRAPFSFTPASRIELLQNQLGQPLPDDFGCLRKAEVLHLRDAQPGVAARIDARKGRKVHVDVERDAMVGAAAHHPDAEGGDLGPVDVDARRTRLALRARADEVDDRLLEQADEGLDLEPSPREVDERIEHYLSRAVVGDVAATVDADRFRYGGFAALPNGVDGRVLEKPKLIQRGLGPRPSKFAHRVPSRNILGQTQALDDDVFDNRHSTMTTS